MGNEIKRINRKLEAKGNVIDFYRDTMLLPDGNTTIWDTVEHKGAAAVIAILNDKILMVRQYRNAVQSNTLEVPAGCLEPNEATIECAKRELEEETGYRCNSIKPLVSITPTPGYSSELIDIFLAQDLVKSEQNLDDGEYVEVETMELDELITMIFNGEIKDAKTIIAIMAYKIVK